MHVFISLLIMMGVMCILYTYIMRMKIHVYKSNCSNPRVEKLKLGAHGV